MGSRAGCLRIEGLNTGYWFTRRIISVPLSRCTLVPCAVITDALPEVAVWAARLKPGIPTTPWLVADKGPETAPPAAPVVAFTAAPVVLPAVPTTPPAVD